MLRQLIWITALLPWAAPGLAGELRQPVNLDIEVRTLNGDRRVNLERVSPLELPQVSSRPGRQLGR